MVKEVAHILLALRWTSFGTLLVISWQSVSENMFCRYWKLQAYWQKGRLVWKRTFSSRNHQSLMPLAAVVNGNGVFQPYADVYFIFWLISNFPALSRSQCIYLRYMLKPADSTKNIKSKSIEGMYEWRFIECLKHVISLAFSQIRCPPLILNEHRCIYTIPYV